LRNSLKKISYKQKVELDKYLKLANKTSVEELYSEDHVKELSKITKVKVDEHVGVRSLQHCASNSCKGLTLSRDFNPVLNMVSRIFSITFKDLKDSFKILKKQKQLQQNNQHGLNMDPIC